MGWKDYLTEVKKPAKSDINKLVKHYALMKYSGRQNANMRSQQKLYNQYFKTQDIISKKYPDLNTSSPRFQQQLEQRADKYWNSKAMRGAGVDW